MAIVRAELVFEGDAAERILGLKERTQAADMVELFSAMARSYEAIVNKASAVEQRGGKVFLLVEFPDGSTEKEPMFDEEEGRPKRVS